ncbi:MAG: putative ribonuclease [Fibrobacteres bacterium]|nr:putative ribonuclease [Fibrobacterota bacterium]
MIQPSQPSYPIDYVDSADGMAKLVKAMEGTDTVFLDLEADSMHHYYAKICLIQILVRDRCYLVDPLSEISLDPFLEKLAGKLLVLHGADYDLRMLYQASGFRPHRVYDTMLAAQLLGKPAFGLAALVHAYFGVTLKKDQQKADWSLRPLPPLMLQYGAQDTFFLPGLYEALTRELEEKNRLEWHEETCEELVKATANSKVIDLENTWRIDGSSKLYPRQLAALQALWKFRDQTARDLDLPSYKVLPSDIILRFALAVPEEGDPEHVPSLPSRLNPAIKNGFLDAYEDALDMPKAEWPQPLRLPRKVAPSPSSVVLNHLKAVRDKIAEDLKMDPSLLATKSTLTAVALTGANSRQKMTEAAKWMKWQEGLLLDAWLKPPERSSAAE